MVSRRTFVKAASGLLVAAGVGELLLPERRVWALDGTMVRAPHLEWVDLYPYGVEQRLDTEGWAVYGLSDGRVLSVPYWWSDNPGTVAAKTIQSAIRRTNMGDVLYLSNGKRDPVLDRFTGYL